MGPPVAYDLNTKHINNFLMDIQTGTISYSYVNGVYSVGAEYTNTADLNRLFGFIIDLTEGDLTTSPPYIVPNYPNLSGGPNEFLASVLARMPAPTPTTQETTVADSADTVSVSVAFTNAAGLGPESASFSYEAIPSITFDEVVVGDSALTLKFTQDKGDAYSSYEYSTDGGNSWGTFNPSDDEGTWEFTISVLINGTEYDLRVKATNGDGYTSDAVDFGKHTPVSAVVPEDEPDITISDVKVGDGEIIVSFTQQKADAYSSYEYNTDFNGGSAWITFNPKLEDGIWEYKISGLDNDTEYTIDIRATNGDGVSTTFGVGQYTPVAPEAVPIIQVYDLKIGDKKLIVYFSQPKEDAYSKYEINTDLSGGSAWVPFDPEYIGSNIGLPVLSRWIYEIKSLTNKTAYTIHLRATNGDGVSCAAVLAGTFTPTKLVAAITINKVIRYQNTNTVKLFMTQFADLDNTSLPTQMRIRQVKKSGSVVKTYNITSIKDGVVSATEVVRGGGR
jgi:hypothetical protein